MNNDVKVIINYLDMYKNMDEGLLNSKDKKLLLDYITNLQEKVNQYENPDDMTLMCMWCDEKAKDKIKQLQEENDHLDKVNCQLRKKINNDIYKSRNEKAIEYINESIKHPTYAENIVADCDGGRVENLDKLLSILQDDIDNK